MLIQNANIAKPAHTQPLRGCGGGSRSLITHVVTSNHQPVGQTANASKEAHGGASTSVIFPSEKTMGRLIDFLGPNKELGDIMGQIYRIRRLLLCPKSSRLV